MGYGHLWRVFHQEVNMVIFSVALPDYGIELRRNDVEAFSKGFEDSFCQHLSPALQDKDQMNMHCEDAMPSCTIIQLLSHRPNVQ